MTETNIGQSHIMFNSKEQYIYFRYSHVYGYFLQRGHDYVQLHNQNKATPIYFILLFFKAQTLTKWKRDMTLSRLLSRKRHWRFVHDRLNVKRKTRGLQYSSGNLPLISSIFTKGMPILSHRR